MVAVLATLAAAQLPPDLDTESQLVEGVQASNTVPMIGKKNSPQGEVSQLLYPYLLRILDLGLRCTLCITPDTCTWHHAGGARPTPRWGRGAARRRPCPAGSSRTSPGWAREASPASPCQTRGRNPKLSANPLYPS